MRYLILNRSGEQSLFKRALHEVLKASGDKLILGYGYLVPGIIQRQEFIQEIRNGLSMENKSIVLIGSNSDTYIEYIETAKFLRNEIPEAEVKVLIKQVNRFGRRQYHKKIAIKVNNNEPVMALLGSSNISGGTYDDGPFSQEVDVLLWNSFIIDQRMEECILGNVNKIQYLDKFRNMRAADVYLNTFNIDLSLEFELEDIIEEVENYQDMRFNLRYISSNSSTRLNKEEIKDMINATTDIYVIKEALMFFYNYATENLQNQNNKRYLISQSSTYQQLIDKMSKTLIIESLQNAQGNISNTLNWNRINGERDSLYDTLLYMLR